MHECAHINVLGIEKSSCLNVETKPRIQWHGAEKLNQWKICICHYALLSAERSSRINVHA